MCIRTETTVKMEEEGTKHSLDVPGEATHLCSGSEAGSYLRLIEFCITQLCNKEEEE